MKFEPLQVSQVLTSKIAPYIYLNWNIDLFWGYNLSLQLVEYNGSEIVNIGLSI